MSVLLLTADLACASKTSAAAARAGCRLETAFTVEALLKKAAAEQPEMVLLDLSSAGLDPRTLVPQLRALPGPPRTIIAFGPHVHEKLLAAATEAGCDQVLARGQFHARADSLLAEYV